MSKLTPFEQAQLDVKEGRLNVPQVGHGAKRLDYFGFQLSNHKYAMGIFAAGMKMRGVSFSQIKKYYGLKGKSAKECKVEMDTLVTEYIKKLQEGSL